MRERYTVQDLLSDLDENIDPNAVFPWFHRNLSKNEAVDLLVRAGNTCPELRVRVTYFSTIQTKGFLRQISNIGFNLTEFPVNLIS